MATSTLGNGTLVLAGTTSGTTTVTATAVAGTTTLTLPAATDTLVGRATTDTLTNKTLTGAVMNGTVGATTPSTGAFTTVSASDIVTSTATAGQVVKAESGTTGILYSNFANTGGTFLYGIDNSAGTALFSGSAAYAGFIGTSGARPLVLATNGAGRAFIDSSGNVGIGTSSPAAKLAVVGTGSIITATRADTNRADMTVTNNGGTVSFGINNSTGSWLTNGLAYYGYILGPTSASYGLQFGVGAANTAALTIDPSGNLLVGDTSAYSGSRLSVKTGNNNGTTHAWYAKNSSATVLGYQRDDGLFNTGAATNSPYNFTTASAANLFVDSSGTFYRSTSSLKYKTDVQDATHGLAEVLSLRPVTYRGKNDGETIFGGLIAEEVDAAGLTEFVQYAEDGTPDALAYGNMVSLCIKAIQQQQAIIQSLTARITALEGA